MLTTLDCIDTFNGVTAYQSGDVERWRRACCVDLLSPISFGRVIVGSTSPARETIDLSCSLVELVLALLGIRSLSSVFF